MLHSSQSAEGIMDSNVFTVLQCVNSYAIRTSISDLWSTTGRTRLRSPIRPMA